MSSYVDFHLTAFTRHIYVRGSVARLCRVSYQNLRVQHCGDGLSVGGGTGRVHQLQRWDVHVWNWSGRM